MTSHDLKHLFDAVATEAAMKVETDQVGLIPQIRRRRRRRVAFTATASTITTAALIAGAYAAIPTPPDNNLAAAPAEPTVTVPEEPSVYKCGQVFPTPTSTGGSMYAISRHSLTSTPTGWSGDTKVTITNGLPGTLVNANPEASFVVVRNNKLVAYARVTTKEPRIELKRRHSHTFNAQLHIKACDTPLPAGSYLLYYDSARDSKATGDTTKHLKATDLIELK